MSLLETSRMLMSYKAWADELTFSAVSALPEGEAIRERQTCFKNMLHTLNHIYVIDCVFKAHLEGRSHPYTARNTTNHPPLPELWESARSIDEWYIDYSSSISESELLEVVNFQYIGGGDGAMSRYEIVLHAANHSTYHRGSVSDMMYQVPATPPTTDLTVFLRDIWPALRSDA